MPRDCTVARMQWLFLAGGIILSAVPLEGGGDDVVESGLYPFMGADSESPKFVKFGERPFYFEIEG